MFSLKQLNPFCTLVLILTAFCLSNCSENSEYGEASDYEKTGFADFIQPTISSVSPSDESTDVSISTAVTVKFSEKMSTNTITTNTDNTTCSGSLQLSSNNFTTCIKMSVSPSALENDTTFTITPADSLSATTTYKLQIINSVKDAAGNTLASSYTTTNGFTTNESGTIKGSVKKANGDALPDVLVSFSGSNVVSTTTDISGNFKKLLDLGSFNLTYTKSGYISTTQSATIETDNQTVVVSTVTLLDSSSCTAGTVAGTISDAVSGNAVSDISLSVRSGLNVTSGSTTGTTAATANNGTYTLSSMNAGGYTVQASKDGYITSYFNVNVCGNLTSQNLSISEALSSGTMRIVLHWGANSGLNILDSHLTGPDNTSGRFHIYWPNGKREFYYYTNDQTCSGCTSSQKSDNVSLDRDDMDGAPGTETITIPSGSWRSGTYRYSAHDYTNRASTSTTKFSTSGTTVKVYYNGTETTYNVPNSAGNLWTVFTIDGSSKVVTSVNSMSFQSLSTGSVY